MYHVFTHSSVERLGCLCVLAIVSNVAVNTGVHESSHYCSLCLHAQEWDCWVMVVLVIVPFFKEPLYCSPQWLYQFTFPPTA